jgi:hypothetical protein
MVSKEAPRDSILPRTFTMDMIWNMIQQSQISHAHSDSIDAKFDAKQARVKAQRIQMELNARLDRLALVCQAIWELLQEASHVTEEELIRKVEELDLRDGKRDGKFVRKVQKCTGCSRVMNTRHPKCLYCGEERLIESAFDGI